MCIIQPILIYPPSLELLLSYLPAPCLFCLSIVWLLLYPFLFPFPHLQVLVPASLPGYLMPVWWVLGVCSIPTVSVHSVSLCHGNLQFLEGEMLWGSSIQTVKPTRDKSTGKFSCQFQTSILNVCKLKFLLKLCQM